MVDRISGLEEMKHFEPPVLRNLHITLGYA